MPAAVTNDANDAKARGSGRVAIAAGVAVIVALAAVVATALAREPAHAPPAPRPPAVVDDASSVGELGTVVWTRVRGMALPVSARFGPAETIGGRASRFSRDWFGALLAAVHICARAAALAGPSVFRPTIGEQVVGADSDDLLATVEANYRQRRDRVGIGPLPNVPSALAGYRFDAVSDSTVALRLVLSGPDPTAPHTVYVAFRLEVRWLRGDWRLVAPPDGSWSGRSTVMPSPGGYTRFPP